MTFKKMFIANFSLLNDGMHRYSSHGTYVSQIVHFAMFCSGGNFPFKTKSTKPQVRLPYKYHTLKEQDKSSDIEEQPSFDDVKRNVRKLL